MTGYTPVFDSVFHGTLVARWPALPVWLTILPMADKNGHIDLTYQAIAALTGWPIDLLKEGIADLMRPDPQSRSPADDGRRLVLVDPEHREWGWRVVNHSQYRERARKQQWDIERTASGRDAERKRLERARPAHGPDVSRDVPSGPDCPRSQTQTQTQTEESEARTSARPTRTASRLPESWELTEERRQVAVAEGIDPERTFAKFCDHWRAASGATARKHDWNATWRNWCRNETDRAPGQARHRGARETSTLPDALERGVRGNARGR